MAKRFFYVCVGIFLLALSWHFGARSATAQAPSNPVVGVAGGNGAWMVVTANGDTYMLSAFVQPGPCWTSNCNVFAGGPTPARQESFGSVKARYR
jgi:hypothetical protein